jgi:hypothetical protein
MSRSRRSIPLEQPPTEIIRGAQIMAEYLAQEVPQFRDNPLNEALPPALTPQEVAEYLLQLPPHSDKPGCRCLRRRESSSSLTVST